MDELVEYYLYKTKIGLKSKLENLPYKVDVAEYETRLNYENKIIIQMGYPGYFLVVQDFINWAKSQGILVGPGRGSGAGALACFALGITNVDPIPYGLIFERFLNPARGGTIVLDEPELSIEDFSTNIMPTVDGEILVQLKDCFLSDRLDTTDIAMYEWDRLSEKQKKYVSYLFNKNIKVSNKSNSTLFYALGLTDTRPVGACRTSGGSLCDLDIDFPKFKRESVIQYVKDKYGHDKVAQIGTFGTFKAKAAIKAVTRTLGYSIPTAEKLTKLWPKAVHGKEITFADALATVPMLSEIYRSEGQEGEILRWAEKCEGRIASFGVHASGVVIGNDPLYETVPLAVGKRGEVVTQWDMNKVEDVGLIKFDFLGLKNLDTIQLAIDHVKTRHNIEIDIENIPLDDDKVYSSLRKGENIGVFQLESSSGMRDLLVKIRPESIEDITALVAMYRPGPLASPKMADYLSWRAGLSEPTYHHPDLKPILAATGGWIVYQEQVLQIAKELAGYSLAEADLLRRAVGKKKEKEMAENYQKFSSGMVKKGFTTDLAQILWQEIEKFADYGFNKSHAFAYAMISYWCAWLKTHYPIEFMAAALTCDSGNMDQMIIYLQECKRLNINVLPPDVNESQLEFTPTDRGIRFGFTAIKNLREGPGNHILDERNVNGPYRGILDFGSRVDLGLINRRKLESLVLAGAFDFTNENRNTLLQAIESILIYRTEFKKYESKFSTYNKKSEAYVERLAAIERGDRAPDREVKDELGNVIEIKPGNKLRLFQEPEEPEIPAQPTIVFQEEMSKQLLLQKEKELTGFFISGHPLDSYAQKMHRNIRSLRDDKPDELVFICILSELQLKESKKKQRYALVRFEDLTGTVEGVIWPWLYEKYKDQLIPNIPMRVAARISYTEADTDEDSEQDEVIPYLDIRAIDLLEQQIDENEDVSVEVSLSVTNINSVKKILEKNTGTTHIASVRFKTNTGDTLVVPKVFGINEDGRKIRSEIIRTTK